MWPWIVVACWAVSGSLAYLVAGRAFYLQAPHITAAPMRRYFSFQYALLGPVGLGAAIIRLLRRSRRHDTGEGRHPALDTLDRSA